MKKCVSYFYSLILMFLVILSACIFFCDLRRNQLKSENDVITLTYFLTKHDSRCTYRTNTGYIFTWKACEQAELGHNYLIIGRITTRPANLFFDYYSLDVSSISLIDDDRRSLLFPVLYLYRFLLKTAEDVQDSISTITSSYLESESAGLVLGLVLGSAQADFSPDFRSLIQSLGLSHMVAVSGFHLGVLALLFTDLFSGFRSPKLRYLVIFFFLFWYALIVSSPLSLLRALFMFILTSIGRYFFKRPIYSFYVLIQVLVLMTTYSWFFLGNIGFELSFLSTAGILLFGGLDVSNMSQSSLDLDIDRSRFSCSSLVTLIKRSILTSLAAQLMSLPVVLYGFGEVAPWGMVSTLVFSASLSFLVAFCAPLLLVCYLLRNLSVTSVLVGPFFAFLNDFCTLLIKGLRIFAHFFGVIIKIEKIPRISLILVYYLFILFILWFWRRLRFRRTQYVY